MAAVAAQTEPVRSRVAVIVDTSAAMRATPEMLTFTDSCSTGNAWNPCTFTTNPSAAQETCNACVRDTIAFDSSCGGMGFWDAACRAAYATCVTALTGQACSPTLTATASITTRGDGSAAQPGCDLDGNDFSDDSRFFLVKEALAGVVVSHDDVELSLWRFRQVVGGQLCDASPACPDTPGGLSILECEDHDSNAGTQSRCVLDADRLDGPTAAGFEGQCSLESFTGSPAGFGCTTCDFANSYERAACELFDLDQVRTNGSSPLGGAVVSCYPLANPTHRFQREHGAQWNAGACDPTGGESLVAFPSTGFDDNRIDILEWIDHGQPDLTIHDELRADGLRPLAASLRDLRSSMVAELAADEASDCRPYRVVVVSAGSESCETVGDAVDAAGDLLGLGLPVHVFGVGPCPATTPNCQARVDLDSIAAAGGTSAAIVVDDPLELAAALEVAISSSVLHETCGDGIDDDCDGVPDNGCPLFTDGFESGDTSAWSDDAPP